jgi:hypothetical protein
MSSISSVKKYFLAFLLCSIAALAVPLPLKIDVSTGAVSDPISLSLFKTGNTIQTDLGFGLTRNAAGPGGSPITSLLTVPTGNYGLYILAPNGSGYPLWTEAQGGQVSLKVAQTTTLAADPALRIWRDATAHNAAVDYFDVRDSSVGGSPIAGLTGSGYFYQADGAVASHTWVGTQGYLTSSALSGYATQSFVTSQGYLTSSALSGYHNGTSGDPFASLSISSSSGSTSINASNNASGLIMNSGSGSSSAQLRITANTNGWLDSQTTAYFQAKTGVNRNLTFMGGTYASDSPLDRLLFCAGYTQFTDIANIATPAPTALYEIINSSASKVALKMRGASSQSGDYVNINSVSGSGGDIFALTAAGDAKVSGNITSTTAGKGIQLKSGTGARAGNATLVGGTVTVTNITVTANTLVITSRKTAGGTLGFLTYTLSSGSSFTITSTSSTDTSVVTYMLVELN